MPEQAKTACRQAAEIRDADGVLSGLDHRIDNALRLPEWRAEHLTKTQATRYRGRPRNPVFAECHPPIVSSVKYTL